MEKAAFYFSHVKNGPVAGEIALFSKMAILDPAIKLRDDSPLDCSAVSMQQGGFSPVLTGKLKEAVCHN